MSILAPETADELFEIARAAQEWKAARTAAVAVVNPETFGRLATAEAGLSAAVAEYERGSG